MKLPRAAVLAAALLGVLGCRTLGGVASAAVIIVEEACDILAPVDPKAKKICTDIRDIENILFKIFLWQRKQTLRQNKGVLLSIEPFANGAPLPTATGAPPPAASGAPLSARTIGPSKPVVIELPEGMTAADLDLP